LEAGRRPFRAAARRQRAQALDFMDEAGGAAFNPQARQSRT
jgi:hypothetical protein